MAEDTPLPGETVPAERRSGCGRFFGFLFLVVLIVAGVVAWKFMDVTREGLSWMSHHFVAQDINVLFRQSVTEIVSTKGDVLEVATMETDETVTHYDMKTLFDRTVYLGTTISEIRVPVVYRYHIRLSDEWKLSVDNDGQCIVHAPALRPSLPPAIRTEGMVKKSEAGWFRFNAAENLAALEKNLTPTMEKRAGNRSHLNQVREASRQSIAEFVKNWLLSQTFTPASQVKSITVIFPDEIPPEGQPRTLPPTVQMP